MLFGVSLVMFWRWLFTLYVTVWVLHGTETFTVVTYNVENYFLEDFDTRKAKSEASRMKVVEFLEAIDADVIALQEMGRRAALTELRGRLKAKGLDYPHEAWVVGPDPAIHLAVLSRFPIAKNRSHKQVSYLLDRKRFQVSRGIGEVEVQVNSRYRFVLFNAHLKSKRPVGFADQAAMRLEEARALRRLVVKRLNANPDENLLVVGDLNDTPNTDPVKDLIGRRAPRLVDLRPVEHNGDQAPHPTNQSYGPRRVAWTHFYWAKDEYSRLDYQLASKGMARELDRSGTRVQAMADWGTASDHRPVVARFFANDR